MEVAAFGVPIRASQSLALQFGYSDAEVPSGSLNRRIARDRLGENDNACRKLRHAPVTGDAIPAPGYLVNEQWHEGSDKRANRSIVASPLRRTGRVARYSLTMKKRFRDGFLIPMFQAGPNLSERRELLAAAQ